MKFHVKVNTLEIKLERPYALPDQPAFEYSVEKYEAKGDLNQLLDGIKDLIEKLQAMVIPPDMPFSFDEDMRLRAEDDAAAEALAKVARESR